MKMRFGTAIAMVAVWFLAGAHGFAAEDSVKWGMCEKGSRGLVNIFTGWMEVPMQIYKGYEDGTKMYTFRDPALSRSAGAIGGLFRGVNHAAGRMGWGVLELGGFWTRNPTSSSEMRQLLDSTYAWEIGQKKAMKCPTFTDGMRKLGDRFERGLSGTIVGVAEFPGQLKKGQAERRRHVGFGKGIWFTASRIWEGAGDVFLIPFAGPEEHKNVPFEEVQPWDALNERYYNNVK